MGFVDGHLSTGTRQDVLPFCAQRIHDVGLQQCLREELDGHRLLDRDESRRLDFVTQNQEYLTYCR